MNLIELKNLTKIYDNEKVVDEINLYIRENEFVTLLGPSGCGKTTTLRMIGGFVQPDDGEILFNGEDLTVVPPYQRQINTVFQRYALFPHLNVYENIAFGLRINKTPKKLIDSKVKRMLKLVNLEGYEKRKIDALSGGQQQRIAIARALVNEPKVLLLDEPLGALDLKLRKEMQIELKAMQQELGITFIYVTHDQEEALTMSDNIVVMKNGVIQQIGSPIDIYNEPKNAFVADFIGESNIVSGIMKKDCLVEINGRQHECVDVGFSTDEAVDVVIRPEDMNLCQADQATFSGQVQSVVFKGVHYEIIFNDNGQTWMVHTTKKVNVDDKVYIKVVPEDFHIMKKVTIC
ncbi:ABC transporter ATP-binding protein [Acidaminobacter sp. JC074]|uniref:spermidine/putrescine ABC transporter ATP-binding protein n=1 Tax=Acidaminobacter sp. JC074 TaxID=2530199 RepID=UPI001F1105EC|nr:spermidine/putrescine ABC transporter ATP-binding protein [Acidaminobacter sp. JC074]MCH4889799.1 ABC transporter ATP-binding protein [Acidaminobacter sp. JC074]